MKQTFPRKRLWIDNFSTCQFLNWKFIVPEDIENKTFRIIIIQRKTIFWKIKFWVQFLRKRISLKNSYVKKIILTQFAPQMATDFSLFLLISKSTILKQFLSLKISVRNEVLLKKKSDYEANFFLGTEILNWKFFNKSDFELSFFRRGRFLKTKLFE